MLTGGCWQFSDPCASLVEGLGSWPQVLAAWASVSRQLTPSNVLAGKGLAGSIDKGVPVFSALLVPLCPLCRAWA